MHYFNPFDGITLYLSITSLTTTCSFIAAEWFTWTCFSRDYKPLSIDKKQKEMGSSLKERTQAYGGQMKDTGIVHETPVFCYEQLRSQPLPFLWRLLRLVQVKPAMDMGCAGFVARGRGQSKRSVCFLCCFCCDTLGISDMKNLVFTHGTRWFQQQFWSRLYYDDEIWCLCHSSLQ